MRRRYDTKKVARLNWMQEVQNQRDVAEIKGGLHRHG